MTMISVQKTINYYVTYVYLHKDLEDGTAAGWYGFVNDRGPNNQSDFVIGPYKTQAEAERLVPDRLANGMPQKTTAKCSSCFTPGMPRRWPNGRLRMYCDSCLDDGR